MSVETTKVKVIARCYVSWIQKKGTLNPIRRKTRSILNVIAVDVSTDVEDEPAIQILKAKTAKTLCALCERSKRGFVPFAFPER